MKVSLRRFVTTLFGLGMLVFGTLDGMTAETKAKPKAEPEQGFLHFGNMGGLLPTLEAGDLKDSDSPGAKGVLKYCGQCHNPPGPGMHTREEWNQVFWRMIWRMQIMRAQFKDFLVPTYAESHAMFSYMTANSIQAISAGDVALQVDGAKEFSRICMQCHRLPSPGQHEGKDWREVVLRMRNHMKSMGKVMPSNEEVDRIVAFLKSTEGVKPQ
ncbi:MAG: cytochrome c [Magnetococcales bacterium]|nr:cytochrome c [Magnetococcales bacterium]